MAGICVRNEQVLDKGGCFSNADCPPGSTCYAFTGECFPKPDAGPTVAESPDGGPPPTCFEGQFRTCGDSKVGACRFGQEPCSEGDWSGQCIGAILPVVREACDDQDDDCDGQVDEDFDKLNDVRNCGGCARVCSYDNAQALCQSGVCAMGDCDSDWWNLNLLDRDGCEYPCHYEGAEECDGVDNDCDGDVDEDFQGLTASCGTGACAVVVKICDLGVPRTCQPPAGSAESCNRIDDDCDGETDEMGTVSCGIGPCHNTVVACADGVPGSCVPLPSSAEECNSQDDDCDGETDEDFAGQVLSCGKGVCYRSTPSCIAGLPQTCVEGTAGSEICDGERKDENCDGRANEDCGCTPPSTLDCYTGPAGTEDVGECHGGTQTCMEISPGRTDYGACESQQVPVGESCNSRDDDCDGTSDEGFGTISCGIGQCARTIQACTGGPGLNTCVAGTPSAPEGDARTDLCNGLDDDCDNSVDEGYSTLSCGTGVCRQSVASCVGGRYYACVPGSPTYAAEGASAPASCNALDDDCDGSTDEAFTVTCGLGVCRRTANTCVGGTYTACAPDTTKQKAEQCNALDDDCDGLTDEDFTDADRDTFTLCQNDCDDNDGTIYPGAAEQCNGKDDDCDGKTDETFDADRDNWSTCNVDPTRIDCNDNNPAINPGATEIPCTNTIDENCDGYAEGCPSDCTKDSDGDGFKGSTNPNKICPDCDDGNKDVHPGATEKCDNYDNDCDKRTIENCGVDQTCYPTGSPDQCEEDLICARRVSDGQFICSSLCNWSVDSGLLDGCASGQSCEYILLPSDNQHACSAPATVGPKTTGQTAGIETECKSHELFDGGALGKYCTDFCADDTYCTPNVYPDTERTYCRIVTSPSPYSTTVYTGQCQKVPSSYLPIGQACSDKGNDSASECRSGDLACVNGICSQTCCNDQHCPVGYHCSNKGKDSYYATSDPPGPNNTVAYYTTVPVCLPNAPTNGGRRAGDACTSNAQCLSEFCERNALSGDGVNGKCVEFCCNDSSCSATGTTTCESVEIDIEGTSPQQRQNARMCVHLPLSAPQLVQKAN